jgi:succinate dehydrogenase / fumarate reductase, iron-sulfur subunit
VIAKMNRDYLRGAWKERSQVITTIAPVTSWDFGQK